MERHLMKRASAVIVLVTYLSTILDLVLFEKVWSLFWITSGLFLLFGLILHREKEWHRKIRFFDLATTIYVVLRLFEKYRLRFALRPAQGYTTAIYYSLCRIIENTVTVLLAAFVIAAVLNAVTSSYGWGLTRIAKSIYYRLYYCFLYKVLRNKVCLWAFRKIVRKKKSLSDAELELFEKAVDRRKKYIGKGKSGRFSYPVVFRKHAVKKSFMPKWLYNISLVPGSKISLEWKNPGVEPRKTEFLVNLTDSNLAIINNTGKTFLRELYEEDKNLREAITKHNKEINEFLSDKNTDKDSVKFQSGSFYRWGSAGTLPIIEWQGDRWIAFVYRDIYPKGWNLPLGASECELEKSRPGITAIREMLEELIVVKEDFSEYGEGKMKQRPKRRELYHPLLNSIEGETNFRAAKRNFYAKQNQIIDHTCQIVFDDEETGYQSLECSDWRTTMRIKVDDDNRKVILPKNVSTNCMITVDNFEQGIECIKPVRFSMEDENVLRMGEVDMLEDTWINNPVILIRYSALQKYFESPEFQQLLDSDMLYSKNDKMFGEGLCLKTILSDPNNYYLFGVNMKDREEYQKYLDSELKKFKTKLSRKHKQFEAQKKYLHSFVKNNKDFFATQDVSKRTIIADLGQTPNQAQYLCPAAWKSCYYLFRKIYEGEQLKSIGE